MNAKNPVEKKRLEKELKARGSKNVKKREGNSRSK
jgi:hypothetical protein